MSTFVRFDGKSYKLPDALTLGRGEPFDIVDRTLARAHARLVHRNGKWKIKDLHTDCGIMVNGNKIRPGKFHSVVPGDVVTLGNVPLEVYESLPESVCTEVKNFTTDNLTDYAPFIYGGLGILAIGIAFLESKGDLMEDVIFLGVIAAFLKLASVVTLALRTVYFPVKVVIETNLTSEGVTFHLTGKKNYSLKFKDLTKWYIVGKCFFVTAYGKNSIFLMNSGHDEFAALLRERCPKNRSLGEPILEKLALTPAVLVLAAWVCLHYADNRFFHFLGQGLGALGLAGLLALFFSEHLRELLPFPNGFSQKKQTLGLAAVITLTIVMQFSQFQNHYKTTRLVKSLHTCVHDKTCTKFNFTVLNSKKLGLEEQKLMERICSEGNKSACPDSQRKPASK